MDLVPLQTRACSAGRDRRFHPLAWFEIDSAGLPFDLGGAMNHGLLPPQWFGVLADTLAGGFLPSFTRTVKRKAIERAKFYLFDPGGCAIFTRRQPYPGARASGASQELARSWPVRAPHAPTAIGCAEAGRAMHRP